MRKLNALKADLPTNQVLTTIEMLHVKGGNNGNGNDNDNNAADDDKRRARPGGGTSTL